MSEREPPGCFPILLVLMTIGFLTPPLAIVAWDFWRAVACHQFEKGCDEPFLLNWKN